MILSPGRRRTVLALGISILVVFFITAGGWHLGTRWYNAPGPHTDEIIVDLPKGTSLDGIAARLGNAGVIERPWLFRAAAIVSGKAAKLKAGEYAFPPAISMREALNKIIEGKAYLHRVSIAEGLTVAEILPLVLEKEALSGAIDTPPLEGSLLPETYYFPRGESRTALIARMQSAQVALLNEAWEKRDPGLVLTSPADAVILASIVEKETGIAAERSLVAGVFHNRLRLGMPLQSDPTVVYALAHAGTPIDRPLSRKDLQYPSPFNTYLNTGLPPAPIANPGRAALLATLHPAQTDALYFVADGTGGHAFATTLQEHNKNVAKLRARERATQ